MDTEHTDIGGKTPREGWRPAAIGRLVARKGKLLSALAVTAAALVLGLTLFYILDDLDDGSDDTPLLAGAGQKMSDEATDSSDLARYCRALTESYDPFFGTLQRTGLIGLVENPLYENFAGLSIVLAFDYLRFGEAEESIRVLTEGLETAEREDPDSADVQRLLEELAITSLKAGELSNRINPSARLVCTLPLGNQQGYEDAQGSTDAIRYYLRLLEMDPENIKYRWLLNIAHMTLGTYPAGVPEQFLIPRELLATDYDIGRFQEVSSEVGLNAVNLAGGSIMDDFDNDGLFDIVTSTWDPGGPIIYYHNDGNGMFSDHTARAGLAGQLGGLNIVQTDYNNDGLLDILVMRGAWLSSKGKMRMSLLRNNGDGTFSDVTRQANLADPAYPSQTAVWADYDNDGDLDLFSCNESGPMFQSPSQLFRNEGDGTFTDVASQAGVRNMRFCKGSGWGDYDNDGDPDLYVSNLLSENRLYRNNGDGSFTDVAPALGVTEPSSSFATWFWDYNNDGWLDLFVAGYGSKIENVAADYLGLPNNGRANAAL